MEVIYVNYNRLLDRPAEEAARVAAFLGGRADADEMAGTVDPSLYRNRKMPENHGVATKGRAEVANVRPRRIGSGDREEEP